MAEVDARWQKIDELFRSESFTGGRLESGKSILRRDILIIPRYSTKVKVSRCAGSRACRINRVKRRSLRTFLFLSVLFRWKQIYRRVTYTIHEATILESRSPLCVISHFDFMTFRFNFIEVFHQGTSRICNGLAYSKDKYRGATNEDTTQRTFIIGTILAGGIEPLISSYPLLWVSLHAEELAKNSVRRESSTNERTNIARANSQEHSSLSATRYVVAVCVSPRVHRSLSTRVNERSYFVLLSF